MINNKITTDIMSTTGFNIDIPPAKVVINNQEITDLETFNKVVDSIKEKDKEIEKLNKDLDTAIEICNNRQKEIVKLNNIINELENYLNDDDWTSVNGVIAIKLIKIKLKELKGSDKECSGLD